MIMMVMMMTMMMVTMRTESQLKTSETVSVVWDLWQKTKRSARDTLNKISFVHSNLQWYRPRRQSVDLEARRGEKSVVFLVCSWVKKSWNSQDTFIRLSDDRRKVLCNYLCAVRTIRRSTSQPAQPQRLDPRRSILKGPRLNLFQSLIHLARPLPNFYRSEKSEIWHCFFDHSRVRRALVRKWSNNIESLNMFWKCR